MADSWTNVNKGPGVKTLGSWRPVDKERYLMRKTWLHWRHFVLQGNAARTAPEDSQRGAGGPQSWVDSYGRAGSLWSRADSYGRAGSLKGRADSYGRAGSLKSRADSYGRSSSVKDAENPSALLASVSWFLPLQPSGLPDSAASGRGLKGPGDLEQIFDRVGHCGRFQLFFYFVCALQNISCGIHYLATVFMTTEPFHTCSPPGNVSQVISSDLSRRNFEDLQILFVRGQERITVQLQNGEIWELSKCEMSCKKNKTLSCHSVSNDSRTKFPCTHGYIYNKSKWESTVVTEWNLVCNREFLAHLIQPTFLLGAMLGAVVFANLADRLGRRLILWPTSTGMFLFGITSAISFDYYSFTTMRFLLALVSGGYLVVVFVYVMEIFGMKYRLWAAILIHCFFAFGIMIVAVVGYLIRTWWLYQIVLSTVTIPFVLFCWMLPETPLWLLSQERYEEAQEVVNMMVTWNGKSSCILKDFLILNLNGSVGYNKAQMHGSLALFHDKSTKIKTLTIWLIWFAGGLGFHLASQSFISLEGNAYINVFITGAVEIPSYIFSCVGIYLVGRRKTIIYYLFSYVLIGGFTVIIQKNHYVLQLMALILGNFTIGAVFDIAFLYTAELYPTTVRCLALGSAYFISRVGNITAYLLRKLFIAWFFMPQVIAGVLTIVSLILTLTLPETQGKSLTTTWEECAMLNKEQSRISNKSFPVSSDTESGKEDMANSNDPSFSK